MPDLYHYWGDDLQVSPAGDLATVDGTTLGEQRVLRRLLTNPGDYVFHPDYGAGLPAKIGTVQDTASLVALIRSQMFQEAVVAATPAPVISVTPIAGSLGAVSISIQYADATTGQQASLTFDLAS